MRYTVNRRNNFSNGTIEFYFTFSDNGGFLNFLSTRQNLRKGFDALAVGIAQAKNTLRLTKPLGTNELEYIEKTKKVLQFYANLHSASIYGGNGDLSDIFGSFFGGFGGKQ